MDDKRSMMIKSGLLLIASLFVVAALMLGCAKQTSELVPITTSSSEALEAYLTGRDLQERLRTLDARPYFEKAINLDPDFALAHLEYATAIGSNKGFFKHLNKAVSLVGKVSEGERLIILAFRAGSDNDQSGTQEYLQQLVELYPNDPRALIRLASFYFGDQIYETAIRYYTRVSELDSTFSAPYNQLGYAYRFLGRYDVAEKAFKKYTELIPDDPNPYDSYAELLMNMGKFDESIEMYEKALAQNSKFNFSHVGIATNLCFKDEYDKARERLQTHMVEGTSDYGARRQGYAVIAFTYLFEGRYEEAITSLHNQYELAEETWDVSAMAGDLSLMGSVYIEAGLPDKARKVYKKALKLIENSELSKPVKHNAERAYLYQSARIAVLKKDLATAKAKARAYQKEAEAMGNNALLANAHQLMAIIALAERMYGRAIEELAQANQRDPYTHFRMMLAYQGLNDHERAKKMCQRVVEFNLINSLSYAFVRNRARDILATQYADKTIFDSLLIDLGFD